MKTLTAKHSDGVYSKLGKGLSQVASVFHDRRIEMLEREVVFQPNGQVPYDDDYRLAVPESSGIYLFFDWRGPLYIGQANNLRRRFCSHFETHNQHLAKAFVNPVGVIQFAWCEVPIQDLAKVESRLINELCPICNIRLNCR